MELVFWSELQQETIRKIIAARRATDFTVEDVVRADNSEWHLP